MDLVNYIIPVIEQFRLLAYWVIMLFSFVESLAFVGVIIPGTFFNIMVGFLAAQGALNLITAIIFSAIGSACGDIVSYYLGSHSKNFFAENNKIFKSSYLEKAKTFLYSHGGKSIFIGKFIGPFRPVIPFVAGLLKTERKVFISWSILSSFAWAATYLILGYFFGQAWQIIILWSTRAGISLAVLVAVFVLFYALKQTIINKGQKISLAIKNSFTTFYTALLNNNKIQNLLYRYPKFFTFFANRFSARNFYGTPLTLLIIIFVYIGFLFGGTIESIIKLEAITQTDIRIANFLAAFRSPKLTVFFTWITLLGKTQIIFSFTIVALGTLVIWKKKRYIMPLLVTMGGSTIFSYITKITINRPRPSVALYLESTPSFPSAHATIAVAFYGFLTYIVLRNIKSWRAKVNYFFLGFWIIALIGFSRVYLGVHFASDVWGGYLVGVLWLIVGISITEILKIRMNKPENPLPHILYNKALLTGLVFISAIFYIIFAQNYAPLITPALLNTNSTIINPVAVLASSPLRYTEALFSEKQKPVNFIFLANSDTDLKDSFQKADWIIADNMRIDSVLKIITAKMVRKSYEASPVTSSFWNTNLHDFGFKKITLEDEKNIRHQIKIWGTGYITKDGKKIYVGAAHYYKNTKIFARNKITPDMDAEREYIFEDLQNAGIVTKFSKEKLSESDLNPELNEISFATDGYVYIVELK